MTIFMTKMLKFGHKFVLLICMTGYCYGALELVFDPENSPPPTIQADPALRVWSMAVNHIMGKPILAQLYNDGVPVTDYSGTCNISTIDTANYNSGGATADGWADSGGTLCQYANRLPYPQSMDPLYEIICSTTTTLEDVPFYGGEVRADGLFHNFTSPPAASKTRVIVFSLMYNGTLVTNATDPIEVTDAAAGLRFSSSPPPNKLANKEIDLDVEIFDSSGSRLTTGSDSTLRITLQVAWMENLTIMHDSSAFLDMVYYENVRLAGTGVVTSKSTYNTVVTKRATGGTASFPGLRLLDVHSCVKLNVTATMPHFPHFRMPYTTNDEKYIYELPNGLLGYHINETSSNPAVLIGNCIAVGEQTATKLVLKNSADIKTKIGANFPIQSYPVIEIQDADGDRVYSGSDANLTVSVSTNVTTACLSNDSVSQNASFGELIYVGSLCDPIGAVQLEFDAVSAISSVNLTSTQTAAIQVTDEIYIASFASTYSSASSSDVGPFVDAFSQYAVEDANAGYFDGILTNRQLIMKSYNTWNDVGKTAQQLLAMVEDGKENPEKKVQGIIGFGSNRLTEAMSSIMSTNKIPSIATVEDEYNFGDKAIYPYFSRVVWDFGGLARATMVLCKERNWMKIVFTRQADYEIHSILYEQATEFGIKVDQEISFPLLSPPLWDAGAFDEQFEKIRKSGTRIIFLFAYAPLSYFIASEAIRHNMGGIDGYQWIFLNEFGWQFPWANQNAVCLTGRVVCTVGFTGLAGIGLMYDITGTSTEDWEHVMTTHTRSYRLNYHGSTPRRSLNEVTAQWGLGYDAARAYVYAFNDLVTNKLTITAESLTDAIRKVQFNGLTGEIKFTTTGNRPGFHGFWVTSNPHPADGTAGPPQTVVFARDLIMENELSTTVIEIPQQARRPMDLPPWNHVIGAYITPNTTYVNKRRFNSSTGMISSSTQQLIPIPPSTDPPVDVVVIETTPAPFYCSNGCGGSALDEYDITKYEFGNCTNMEKCSCNYGYIGDYCQTMSCSCKNGHCEIPFECICDSGWTGSECEIPICDDVSCGSHGECTGPDECTCDSGYTGKECNMILVVVIVMPLLAGIVAIVGTVFFIRWFLKRQHLMAALKNLDWMVKWDEVMIGDARALSFLSTAGDEFTQSNKANIGTWRSQKCYIQKFNCDTLNVENENLRYEIVKMKELRHNNIITFVGACLDYPYVSVLTEVAPKGSIEDLLSNESVKLGWDFRFSLLKDVCRGMEFLHRSEIGSHGRLKSSNCVVDNRWTCKITGFGLPTLRYDGPRKLRPNHEDISKPSELLWTAPEILKTGVKKLDDVRFGTKAGDVYSFGILLTEVCTREEPFSNEMGLLTIEGILTLIRDKDAADSADAKRIWYKSGGDTTKAFRPKIDDDCLPEEYAAKTGYLKLMESAWGTNPDLRPTFRQMLDRLNEIYPIKGELIDNLVNMLEKYSSNLEAIVAERTKDLIAEKAKTEQLLSQMLPKKVMEDLKHGKPVEPESFECVTIFFSDIVGFTKIAGGSTPLQIVDLLNDLYTTFDAILDNYDVYKVETIGDAYVVVSGLPIRNGDLHAGEIATMSLDLMASLMEFKIRHMPGETLQLRIGMHSGPCVAGVVGLKMPRYCLFGDTVNTASRMESNSMALRIHMSSYTRDILVRLGGYHLDCRGEIEAKGKGKMTTYWLNGKDGFDKKLPGKDMAASLSQHEFK